MNFVQPRKAIIGCLDNMEEEFESVDYASYMLDIDKKHIYKSVKYGTKTNHCDSCVCYIK